MNPITEGILIVMAIWLGYYLGKNNYLRKSNPQLKLLKSKLSKEEFELFDKNLRLLKNESVIEYCCEEHRKNYSLHVLIRSAFSFDQTEQGVKYWQEISNR